MSEVMQGVILGAIIATVGCCLGFTFAFQWWTPREPRTGFPRKTLEDYGVYVQKETTRKVTTKQ